MAMQAEMPATATMRVRIKSEVLHSRSNVLAKQLRTEAASMQER
jgi:hypothetical protein